MFSITVALYDGLTCYCINTETMVLGVKERIMETHHYIHDCLTASVFTSSGCNCVFKAHKLLLCVALQWTIHTAKAALSDVASKTTLNAKYRTISMSTHSCTNTRIHMHIYSVHCCCADYYCEDSNCSWNYTIKFIFCIFLYWQGPETQFTVKQWNNWKTAITLLLMIHLMLPCVSLSFISALHYQQ